MFYTEIVVFVVLSIENVGIEYSFTRKECLLCICAWCAEILCALRSAVVVLHVTNIFLKKYYFNILILNYFFMYL